METILFQYIRIETVQELIDIFYQEIFLGYLRECCEHIFQISHGADMLTEKEFNAILEEKTDAINQLLKKELSGLINEIVTTSTKPPYKDNFPDRILIEDDKFIQLVEILCDDFQNGCKNFVYNK